MEPKRECKERAWVLRYIYKQMAADSHASIINNHKKYEYSSVSECHYRSSRQSCCWGYNDTEIAKVSLAKRLSKLLSTAQAQIHEYASKSERKEFLCIQSTKLDKLALDGWYMPPLPCREGNRELDLSFLLSFSKRRLKIAAFLYSLYIW